MKTQKSRTIRESTEYIRKWVWLDEKKGKPMSQKELTEEESGPPRKLEKTKGAKCRKPIRLSQPGSEGDLEEHKFS